MICSIPTKQYRSFICRYISTDLWTNELNYDIRKKTEEYWFKHLKYDNQFNKRHIGEKFYVLSMFPYTSGNLHLGHVRVYIISDTLARFHRMNDKNVFQPMGWDAFGLPAENAAIERGIKPKEWTEKNINQMRDQLKRLHCTFDWKSEINTSSPSYYKWTQYLFLRMFDAGLVYQKVASVNWDPVDETVLADEQVDEKGRSWRSGAYVQKKFLKQWFIRTTRFSKDLYEGLDEEKMFHWFDIRTIQKNWIGECDGVAFDLKILASADDANYLNVWVKDSADIVQAEFIVAQPNSFIDSLCNHKRDENGKLELSILNPFTDRVLPVYVSSDVPYAFGRDTYVGVPSKLEFDRHFAEKVGLQWELNTKVIDNEEICERAKKLGIGGFRVSSKIKDWLISRQRYWGTPIPVIHCSSCGAQPVPYDQLPVELPPVPEKFEIGKGLNKLLQSSEWINALCPKCGAKALRETDTMDTFMDSSWYYLRYIDNNNEKESFCSKAVNQILPVDFYAGGKEHAVLHLYYARFISYFLHSIGFIKYREPFVKLLCQGMVKNRTYKTQKGNYLKLDEVVIEGETAKSKGTGEELVVTWEKMSKSKNNGIDPSEVLETHGVDMTRLLLLYQADPRAHLEWNGEVSQGVLLWQHRLWLTIREFQKVRQQPLIKEGQPCIVMREENAALRSHRNCYVRRITFSYAISYNLTSCICQLQELTKILRRAPREVRKFSIEYEQTLAACIIMLAPVIPHFAATLWFGFTSATGRLNTNSDEIKWDKNVLNQNWPRIEESFEVPLYCQINERPFVEIGAPHLDTSSLTNEDVIQQCWKWPEIERHLKRKEIVDVRIEKHKNLCVSVFLKTKKQRIYATDNKMDVKVIPEKRSLQNG